GASLLHVVREVAVREHRAFGDAGRAARVLKYGNVVHADGRVHRGRARLRARDEVSEEVDPRPGGYLGDRGMGFLPLQLERREQVEREPQVLGDPRDHVVRDRQLRAVVLDLLVEGEVRHNRDAAAGVLPLVLQLARGVQRKEDRKSTRLNSSHVASSYAVFCLKKKKITTTTPADSFIAAVASSGRAES